MTTLLSPSVASRPGRLSISFILSVLLTALVVSGCDTFKDEVVTATVSGTIVDARNTPVADALVTLSFDDAGQPSQTTSTDDTGAYSFTFDVDENQSLSVTVRATLRGSDVGTQTLVVSSDNATRANVNFVLEDDEGDDGQQPSTTSGTLSRLEANGVSNPTIRVIESGGPETVALTFVARDSIGRRLTAEQAVDVRFSLGLNPGDGLEVNPSTARTNALGEATVVVSSGRRAGVVQLVAEADAADGTAVRADPVRITIHGGHPDQAHFTVAPVQRNIPGRVRYNETTSMEVIVGDTFSNPVVPGTAVYYATTHGVVDGSTETDASGLGAAILRSANPLPNSNGIAVVTAETAGEDEQRVFGQTPVLFSGPTVIRLRPQQADFGSYSLSVTDDLGNPLASGTSITVEAEGTGVLTSGFTETTLDDTGIFVNDANGNGLLEPSEATPATGPGITEFPFSVSPDPESDQTPAVTAIVVTVTSPNGDLELSVFASATNATLAKSGPRIETSEDAIVQTHADGSITVQAAPAR